MNYLFDSTEKNLNDSIKSLSETDIIDICGIKNAHKGMDYLNDKLIFDTTFNETKTLFKAVVSGNSDYKVTIIFRDNEISGSCTCPVQGVCKHLATVLFYLQKTTEKISEGENDMTEHVVEQYIQSLSKQELVNLLRKHAPITFWNELKNNHSDKNTALEQFKKIEQKINKIFKDDDLLYDPLAFEAEVERVLSHFIGLEKVLTNECGHFIFNFFDKVEKIQNEGMLYDDYNDSTFTSPDVFDKLVKNYALNLDFEGKLQFLIKLDLALENQPYNTFIHLLDISNSLFNFDELPLLKETFLRRKDQLPLIYKESFYRLLEHLLTSDEKEKLLLSMQYDNPCWLIRLIRLYELNGNEKTAFDTVKKYIESEIYKKSEDVYIVYLDLLKKNNIPLEGAAEEALNCYPNQKMLLMVIDNDPSNTLKYEHILLNRRPEAGLDYLEKKNRLNEALELVCSSAHIYEDRKKDFFKKHKTNFPSEATTFFSAIITEHLKEAGENHYYAIMDAIGQLLVINQKLAKLTLEDIRVNYKRRRNLINLLQKY